MTKKRVTSTDVLRRARELIARGWTKKDIARTKNGKPASYRSPEAVKFCVYGAVCRAGVELVPAAGFPRASDIAWQCVLKVTPDKDPTKFNDAPSTR